MDQKVDFLSNLEKLHTTVMGIDRIKKNLGLDVEDAVLWCRKKIEESDRQVTRKGKNWYAKTGDCVITVNAYTYTIITAHKTKNYFAVAKGDQL